MQRLESARKPLTIAVAYAGMLAAAAGIFRWLTSLGTKQALALEAASLPSVRREHLNELAHVLFALLVILVSSRLVGALFRRFSQPAVIGEVVAGLLLGPSFLGRFAPNAASYLLPTSVAPHLSMLAQVGVVLYMFLVGLELDTGLLRKHGHTTLAISHASIVVPFLLGTATALLLYRELSGPGVPFVTFAMFIGVSLSVTAFPVLARIVDDANLQRSRLGALALSCAAIDDVTAWCLLAALQGLALSSAAHLAQTLLLTLGYLALVFGLVRPYLLRFCARHTGARPLGSGAFAALLAALLASALISESIGIHALFGAFLLGSLISHDSPLAHELSRRLKEVVVVLLLPAFFAVTGMRTHLDLIAGASGWLLCGLIVLVACVGKLGGSALAARFCGLGWRDAAALGALMNTRGLMELVVLNLGLELKLISPALFAMMVLMAVVTTLMTAPLLRALTGVNVAGAAKTSEAVVAST
jgi:Kef-type K+ transport system membrane component KefB